MVLENLKKKDYISAIGNFTSAISIKDDFADAYFNRAVAKEEFAKQAGFENSEHCFDLKSCYEIW